MEGKSACSNYIIDMTAAEFGACKNCGLKKMAHNSQATANTLKPNEGGLKAKMQVFSQGNFVPTPANQNKKPEPKPFEKKSFAPAKEPEKKPDPPKEVEKKPAAYVKPAPQKEENEEKKEACNDFKIDVTATEFNTCKNCHLHRRLHGDPSNANSFPSNRTSYNNKVQMESNVITKRAEELDRKEKEEREDKKREQERKDKDKREQDKKEQEKGEQVKKDQERKKEQPKPKVEDENDGNDTKKVCSNFQIDVTASEFNTCKNCHLLRKFHDSQAVTSGNMNTTPGTSLNDRMQKFNNPSNKQGPTPSTNPNTYTYKKSQSEYPVRQSQAKKVDDSEVVKAEDFVSNRASNKPSQSIPIVEGVPSIKDRMKFLNEKKDKPKENLAAEEIRKAGASVKDLAVNLTNLGLLAPKLPPPQPVEEGLEQIPETGNENNRGSVEEEKKPLEEQPKPNVEDSSNIGMEKPLQKSKKTMTKKPDGMNFDSDEKNDIAIREKTLTISNKLPDPPKIQNDPPAMPKPVVNNPAPIFNPPPPINKPPEIKKEVPKPPEIKKDPPKPPEIKPDAGILKENPAANLGGSKKKQLFSDSESDGNSDDDDPIKRELREKLARAHSKKLNI